MQRKPPRGPDSDVPLELVKRASRDLGSLSDDELMMLAAADHRAPFALLLDYAASGVHSCDCPFGPPGQEVCRRHRLPRSGPGRPPSRRREPGANQRWRHGLEFIG